MIQRLEQIDAMRDELVDVLASVRVARRLSLPAQCEVGFAVGPGIDVATSAPIGAGIEVSVVASDGLAARSRTDTP